MKPSRHVVRFPPLQWGVFLERTNRFAAVIQVDDEELAVHVPSSGRMGELLRAGASVAWEPAADSNGRRTKGKLVLADAGGTLVCVDAMMPNRLIWSLWQRGDLAELQFYPRLRREFTHGRSRFDFADPSGFLLVETKSVTLVNKGLALFPDSPTTRGTKHLLELAEAARAGWRAMVYFIVQRRDAQVFTANAAKDPPFAEALAQAVASGVEIRVRKSIFDESGIYHLEPVPLRSA